MADWRKTMILVLDPGSVNLSELKDLYKACRWDWLEPDAEMHAALKGSFRLYGAIIDDRIVGFARTISDGKICGLLIDFMVHPAFRKRGIGLELANFIVNDSRNCGLQVIQLLASKEGSPLYQKAGFTSCPSSSPGMVKFIAAGCD